MPKSNDIMNGCKKGIVFAPAITLPFLVVISQKQNTPPALYTEISANKASKIL